MAEPLGDPDPDPLPSGPPSPTSPTLVFPRSAHPSPESPHPSSDSTSSAPDLRADGSFCCLLCSLASLTWDPPAQPAGSQCGAGGHTPCCRSHSPRSSSLSPAAALFFPGGTSEGRSKSRRWAEDFFHDDSDDDVLQDASPPPTPHAACRQQQRPSSPTAAPECSVVSGRGTGWVDVGRHRRRPRRRHRKRPRAALGSPPRLGWCGDRPASRGGTCGDRAHEVAADAQRCATPAAKWKRHLRRSARSEPDVRGAPLLPPTRVPAQRRLGLPLRIPVYQCLGPQLGASGSVTPRRHPRVAHVPRLGSSVDADGFHIVECRRRSRRRTPRRRRSVPPELVGLCFNCLAHDHVVAKCCFPSRCFLCQGTGHRAKPCKRGRSLPCESSSETGHTQGAPRMYRHAGPRRPSLSPGCCGAPSSPNRVRPSSPLQHHNNTLPLQHPLGDTGSSPRVEVFVISRNAEQAMAEADLPLVLVALVGGNRPSVSPAEVRAHLSSVYHVLEGAACVKAPFVQIGAVLCPVTSEVEPTIVRSARKSSQDGLHGSSCVVAELEVETDLVWSGPRQMYPVIDTALDPMLLEVEIRDSTSSDRRCSASEPAGRDGGSSPIRSQSSSSILLSSPARASWASGLMDDQQAQHQQLFIDNHGPSMLVCGTDCSPTTIVASPLVQPNSVEDFIAGLKLPLELPLVQSPPRGRVSRVRDVNLVPRRSERPAAKSVYRDPNPEKQAKRVLLGKWQPSASTQRSEPLTPDATIATQFHETFQEPLSSSKRAAMQELFPMAGVRGRMPAMQGF